MKYKKTDYIERETEFCNTGLWTSKTKIRYDFLKIMPLYKWQYCHEVLVKQKDTYCDGCFHQFLEEFVLCGSNTKDIIKLNCLDKKQKNKLIKLIERLKKESEKPDSETWLV